MYDWISAYSDPDAITVLEDLSIQHALRGGPVGAEIAALIKAHDYAALIRFELNPNAPDWGIYSLIECRQALAFWQKYEPLVVPGVDKEATAAGKFWETEKACSFTNECFVQHSLGRFSFLPHVERALRGARARIKRVLGGAPSIDELPLKFGPGATATIRKADAVPQEKLADRPSCSYDLLASGLLPELLRSMPHYTTEHSTKHWFEPVPSDVTWEGKESAARAHSNKHWVWLVESVDVDVMTSSLSFVPKNALTYRSIDVQPTLNTILQGGIGRTMRKLLLARAGVDIRDQTQNQRLAQYASITGILATLDLSSASDLIARELVRYLVPADWYRLLAGAACSQTRYNGTTHVLQKFCSMGNGFTFPLETLIFWALSDEPLGDRNYWLSVYGDDIIVPANKAGDVVAALEGAGFIVNKKKSFVDGPFRESCGVEYYSGISTRPYFQKDAVSCETLFTLHNFYFRENNPEMCKSVLAHIPEYFHWVVGPDGYGDGHLLSNRWTKKRNRSMRRAGYGGSCFTTFTRKPAYKMSRFPGDYVTPLYCLYIRGDGDMEDSTPTLFTESGRPLWPNGTESYRSVDIYTFAP